MEKQRYPAIFGSAKRWHVSLGTLNNFFALEERDFISEVQGFGTSGKKRYEAVIEEGWLRRICVPDNPNMRNGIKRGKRHYVITFGDKMAPYGRPEVWINKSILLHLVTTARHRHCIVMDNVRRWDNEIWLKTARKDLLETVCNGHAPDALLEMKNGDYWGIELLAKGMAEATKEWRKKSRIWQKASMSKIIWLRMNNPWKDPAYYMFAPPVESTTREE